MRERETESRCAPGGGGGVRERESIWINAHGQTPMLKHVINQMLIPSEKSNKWVMEG